MTEGQQNKMNLHQGNMRAPRHQCREEEPVAEVKQFQGARLLEWNDP